VDVFTVRITHKRLTLSPFTSEQMTMIGESLLSSVKTRLSLGLNTQDTAAPPLSTKYANRKMRMNRTPIRNLSWSGALMKSLRVKSASETGVTIGPINPLASLKLTVNNRRAKQWGISPKDQEKINKFAFIFLQQRIKVVTGIDLANEDITRVA
jgi:hypothetical protein